MTHPDYEKRLDDLLKVLVQHVEDHHPDPDATKPCGVIEDVAQALTKLTEEVVDEVAKNALVIAEYWLEEDGRPKHLIQDLRDVKDISVLEHIDKKYVDMYKASPQRTTTTKILKGDSNTITEFSSNTSFRLGSDGLPLGTIHKVE